MKECEEIKRVNPAVDVGKYMHKLKLTALNLFYNSVRSLEFDGIGPMEQEFVYRSKRCGLMYCEEGYKGYLIGLDINGYYASLMSMKTRFQLPVGGAQFKKFSVLPAVLK